MVELSNNNFYPANQETFYYFRVNTYYSLYISQTLYAELAFPEQIKKSPE